jgi:hypothetical protein
MWRAFGCHRNDERTPFVSDPTSIEMQTSRAAIARAAGTFASDVGVYQAPSSEAGTLVMATIATATDPWTCSSDSRGDVSNVRFTGDGGSSRGGRESTRGRSPFPGGCAGGVDAGKGVRPVVS